MSAMRELVAGFDLFEFVEVCLVEEYGFGGTERVIFVENQGANPRFLASVVGGEPGTEREWEREEGWDCSVGEEGGGLA